MAYPRMVTFLSFISVFVFGYSNAAVYNVGDSAGWTLIGNVDYNSWASSKTFLVGDSVVFEYDPRYHNVVRVSRADFHSCDTTAPIATYATGNDTIALARPGHYFYICGFVGHCQSGQKVDLRVMKPIVVPTSSPIIETPHVMAAPDVSPQAPSPSPNNGESLEYTLFCGYIGFLLIAIWNVV